MQRHFGHRSGVSEAVRPEPNRPFVLCPPTLTFFCVSYNPRVLLNSSCAKKWVV